MIKLPLISVIIPIYKTEQYLRTCVDSIITQTHTNLEIILVNDGSPDNSIQLCEEYFAKDERIKIVNRKNGGLSAARNSGLEVATGDFVAFIDSDDYVEPCMFEMLLKLMRQYDADISQCGVTSADGMQYCVDLKNNVFIYAF